MTNVDVLMSIECRMTNSDFVIRASSKKHGFDGGRRQRGVPTTWRKFEGAFTHGRQPVGAARRADREASSIRPRRACSALVIRHSSFVIATA